MKKSFFSMLSLVLMIAFAMTAVTFTSCSNDDDDVVTPAPDPQPEEGWYEIKSEKSLYDILGSSYKSIVVDYTSVSPDLKTRQVVSGLITIPDGPVFATVIDNHYTIACNAEAPSQTGSSLAGEFVGGLFCFVSTDYIGFGTTKDQYQTYLNHEACARQSIDLALVAQKILKERNLDGGKLFNVGYSQGGAVALAVHRAMEKDSELAKKLNFTASWCGDGPYDVVATVKYYLANADAVSYPAGLPLLVEGFLSSASADLKGDLKFADFFTDKLISKGLESWVRGRELTTTDINAKMQQIVGSETLKLSQIFSPEMAVENGALMQKYLKFAELNNLCKDWTPSFPLRFIHNMYDDVVPVINAQNAVSGLGLDPDVAASYYYYPVSHADFGGVYYGTVLAELGDYFGVDLSFVLNYIMNQ